MSPRITPSAEQEVQFNASFRYEMAALLSQSVPYVRHGDSIAAANWAAADSLLESTLIRLRSMHQFFTNKRTKGDAIAADLAPAWQPRPVMRSRDYRHIGKRVAHLTYSRPVEHTWPIGEMVGKALRNGLDYMEVVGCDSREGWSELFEAIELERSTWGDLDQAAASTDQHARRPS